jgi:hypothetical protein
MKSRDSRAATLIFLGTLVAAVALSVANDWVLGQRGWLPSAWRRGETWERAAEGKLNALEGKYGVLDRYVPWTTEFDREQEQIRADAGIQHSKWASPVAHLDEFMVVYCKAAAVEGVLWGGGVGLLTASAFLLLRRRRRSQA